MTAKQYVNAITRKIKCSSQKKKDIKKQLLLDINLRLEQGEPLTDIITQMGSVYEIADSFNENLSIREKNQYKRNKFLKIVIPTVLILAAFICLIYWAIPKGKNIESSTRFDKTQVEAAMKNTIELLDNEDYSALQENATAQMQPSLNAATIENAKKKISSQWGTRKQFGTVYISELVQMNTHYAVGEITVTYDNTSVTYRLTYNETMQLAGLYMR